jgi:hypothetical protein
MMGNVCASTSHLVLEQKYKSKKRNSLPEKKHYYEKIKDIIQKEKTYENNVNNNGKPIEFYSDDEDALSTDQKSFNSLKSNQTDNMRSLSMLSMKTEESFDVEGSYLFDDEIRSEDITSMKSEFTNKSLVYSRPKSREKKEGFKSKVMKKFKPKQVKERVKTNTNNEQKHKKPKDEFKEVKNSDTSLRTIGSNTLKKAHDSAHQFLFKEEKQIDFPLNENLSKTSDKIETISDCSSYDALSDIIIPFDRYANCIAHEPVLKESGIKWLTESVNFIMSNNSSFK